MASSSIIKMNTPQSGQSSQLIFATNDRNAPGFARGNARVDSLASVELEGSGEKLLEAQRLCRIDLCRPPRRDKAGGECNDEKSNRH